MIKNIIFDFGDVFIDLDKEVLWRELLTIDSPEHIAQLKALNNAFEIGKIPGTSFLEGLQKVFPERDQNALAHLWNSMLLEFPESRLEFLEQLATSGKYRLFLLSNTNEIHIAHVEEKMGTMRFRRFRNCFEGFHLSHELRMRKPDREVFDFLLSHHALSAHETLFVDDTLENIEAAGEMGINTWHLQVGTEEVTELDARIRIW